jgi:hypothetical protein
MAIPFALAFQRRDAPVEIRLVPRPFLACTACEHCEAASPENVRSRRGR